jgi:deoxyinosine 3'endonuclease (endonuclease V)
MANTEINNWIKYQESGAKQVIVQDIMQFDAIKYIGGLDISFNKIDNSRGCAYLSILDLSTGQIVYETHQLCQLTVPYCSGFLGFREIPIYKNLIAQAKTEGWVPDVIMVDGTGILHDRKFGCASHLGVEIDIPTIGVSKTLLCVDGLDEKAIKNKFRTSCQSKSDSIELVGKSGFIYGLALKTNALATNPLYVSVGHKISLETAKSIVLATCTYKNPEPIRNSDIKSKLYL